ncbi:LAETG motif-containing sortase-dependent surface protein [Streptomyces sp. V3I7]|uniref:LAETG motif-containing sortase-dependent surface protein n=1 Tax=Streptomyces sp. V3I7 TaxID=3042278 RepID=UPI0027D848C3|nr:LAETG motif-containing sortase-dependent surface protein [Streptomyces sp. V3I7]
MTVHPSCVILAGFPRSFVRETPPATPATPAAAPKPQGAPATEADLATTGGSPLTPYLAAGSAALLAMGAGTLALARRRRGRRG